MANIPKPVVLMILDGFGFSQNTSFNAIANANTPCFDKLLKNYSNSLIECSGDFVGLPDQQMGNSEVGHIHIGAGRKVRQELSRISKSIEDGSFYSNPVLLEMIDYLKKNDKSLHVMGLLSDGGVHSHENHIYAMIDLAVKSGLKKVFVHAFLDGRDVPPKSAIDSIKALENKLDAFGGGKIASVVGRFYAMDRDNRWERVEQAYQLIVTGKAEYSASSASEAVAMAYERGETDEFVEATTIQNANNASVQISEGDAFVFMNFRADRAREISKALTDEDFTGFQREVFCRPGRFVTLTQYSEDFSYPVIFSPVSIKNSIGEVVSELGLKQLRLAETEKYAHVTFFLNGGSDHSYPGEDRILVPSPKVKTYDLQPEMNAIEVTEALVKAIREQSYDLIICNYANCDMVGHTGNYEAALQAVEIIDQAVQQVVEALNSVGGEMLITADHGNIEQMVNPQTGQPHTAHTSNPVPLIYIGSKGNVKEGGSLSDLSPTLLDLLGVDKPFEMTGTSLVESSLSGQSMSKAAGMAQN